MKTGWHPVTLGEVCVFERGLTYSKSDEVEFSKNGVLRANNIDLATNELNFTDIRYIADSVNVPASKKIKRGSLLICTASGSRSHLGKVAFVDDDYDFAFGGFMGLITPNERIESRFLYYSLTDVMFQRKLDSLSTGTNINNLKFRDIADFLIVLPPLEEQRRIVAVLDEAFAAIATATANAEKNRANARELFSSAIEEVLKSRSGGRMVALSDAVEPDCTLSYGIVQPGEECLGGLPVVRPTDLGPKYIGLGELKRIDPSLALSYQRTTLKGDDLLLCVRGTTGTLSIATPELLGGNVTRGIVPIRFDPAILLQDLGYFLLLSSSVQKQIKAATYGAALMQINIRDLKQLMLFVPPLKDQAAIASHLSAAQADAERLQANYRAKLDALRKLKQSLLGRAFNGELTPAKVEQITA